MQVPLWVCVSSLLFALSLPWVWHEMANSLLLRSVLKPTSSFLSPLLFSSTTSLFHSKPSAHHPVHYFSTTSSTMSSSPSASFFELIKNRRSIYQLSNTSTIPDSKILSIVNEAVLHVPSSFNSQSTRVLVLLGEEHEKLWDITKEVLKAVVPEEAFSSTEAKLTGFRGGYGTVGLPSYKMF
jgi:hypothetical protein